MILDLLPSPFGDAFADWQDAVSESCLLCSPYITMLRTKGIAQTVTVDVLTDISTANVVNGALDLDALLFLAGAVERTRITYLPRLHAKVFTADNRLAVIGSANFTEGGTYRNWEYGVRIRDEETVKQVRGDLNRYAHLGTVVSPDDLRAVRGDTDTLREAIRAEQEEIRAKIRAASPRLTAISEDNLIRLRVKERSVKALFSDTILYLLAGSAMTTAALNVAMKEIYPDLCDDTADRVIDGKHYGKLWKHAVRGAQVTLHRQGKIEYDKGTRFWHLRKEA